MQDKIIALTFDDGPNTVTTPRVLDVLEKYGAAGTFFLVGSNINELSAQAVKRACSLGCEIENHSLTHSDMTKMTAQEIADEIAETSRRVAEITGRQPRFFRPPYIAVNQTMVDTVKLPFIAGFGAEDWLDEVTARQRAEKVLAQARDGAVILLHDMEGNEQTVQALDMIIPALKEQGYRFVTVSQLFEQSGVTPDAESFIVYSYTQQTTAYA